MRMPAFLKSLHLSAEPPVGGGEACPKALRLLGAERWGEARLRAVAALAAAFRCPCCSRLLSHLRERIGSTLFVDDDPESLAQAFMADERDHDSARVLAACIVLAGRERKPAPTC
jgi:hypothetical protein